METKVRIDKYLWAVRLYKTRTLAAEEIKLGKVKLNGNVVKASYEVKKGDEFLINHNQIQKTIKVVLPLGNRDGAALVKDYMLDITHPDVYEAHKLKSEMVFAKRDKGTGRPSKKDRRDLTDFY